MMHYYLPGFQCLGVYYDNFDRSQFIRNNAYCCINTSQGV